MKIIRVLHQNTPRWAVLKDPENYNLMFGDLFRLPPDIDARPHHLDHSKMLPPVQPTKIVAVGLNYRDHTKEIGKTDPENPILFLKPPSALLAPGGVVALPPSSSRVDHEAELAIVLKSRLRNANEAEALKAIWGYTCLNDVTARDLQNQDGQWTRAKGFDTFCPVGPWIDTDFKEGSQTILCRVNGEERQRSTLDQRIWNCVQLLAFASSVMTLEPMDVLTTGTPAGISPLKPGDVVEVEIEGLGVLKNTVAAS